MGLKPAIGLRIFASFPWWFAIAIIRHSAHVVHGVANGIIGHVVVLSAAIEAWYIDFVLIFATWARTLWIFGRTVIAALVIKVLDHVIWLLIVQLILKCYEVFVPPLLATFDIRVALVGVHRSLGARHGGLRREIRGHLVIFDLYSTLLIVVSIGQLDKICSLGDKHSINYLANLFFKFNFQFSK